MLLTHFKLRNRAKDKIKLRRLSFDLPIGRIAHSTIPLIGSFTTAILKWGNNMITSDELDVLVNELLEMRK